MKNINNIYLDCNIILDWILDRLPFSEYAIKLITLIEKKEIIGFISPLVLSNSYYIIRKQKNRKLAEEFLLDCKNIFNFLEISKESTLKAIENRYKDFEDDLHYFAAIENKSIEYFITRNKKDFKSKNIRILTAEEFLYENDYLQGNFP